MKCDELKRFEIVGKYTDEETIGECYDADEVDAAIAELKKEIESMKVKFREFNDNVCKKIVDVSRTMSTISQDAQMDFYEEFVKNEVNNG